MRKRINTRVVGYEKYEVYEMDWQFLMSSNETNVSFVASQREWCIVLENKLKTSFDNKIKLSENSRVWIHPSCKLPRNEVYSKYTKSPDILSADAVIIPERRGCYHYPMNCLVAVNESANICVLMNFYWEERWAKLSSNVEVGKTKLKDVINFGTRQCSGFDVVSDKVPAFKEAVVMYNGKCWHVPQSYSYFADIRAGIIPEERVMHEDELRKQMSEKETLTPEELSSVYEMLLSKDDDTISLGLRTLASMPYSKYPCSSLFVLKETLDLNERWAYSKAVRLTAVNAMLKHFDYYRCRIGYGRYNSISHDDWRLLRPLMRKYDGYRFYKLNSMMFLKINPDTDTLTPVFCD